MPETSPRSVAPDARPLLVALHFLGSSAEQWEPLGAALGDQFAFLPIDLPGFGEAAHRTGYDVASMADHVAREVRERGPRRWLLVGHSMGAKVACAVARMAEDRVEGLGGLTHLVLLAGSPPGPEPMEDDKREAMRGWFAGPDPVRRQEAEHYIRDNVARALLPDLHEGLVAAVLKARRDAWLAWLDSGSREDWTVRIGTLRTPALILAGAKDAALGIAAQRTAMAPHFASVRLHVMPDTGHLLPVERPQAVADCIRAFVGQPERHEPAIPAAYRAIIGSPRVSDRTRKVLLARAEPIDHQDGLPPDAWATLQALVDRVIPQGGEQRIDIAARLVRMTLGSANDGWRFDELPPDRPALQAGLRNLDAIARTLDAAGFAFLPTEQQDALLTALAEARLTSPLLPEDGGLTARQLQLWFEDMRSFATQIYVAHPATAARIGFSGIANRGDGSGPQGFAAVGLGQREPWEPVAGGSR